MCEGFDPLDHSLLPSIDVRVVSRWLSLAMSLTAMFTLFQNQDLVNSPET